MEEYRLSNLAVNACAYDYDALGAIYGYYGKSIMATAYCLTMDSCAIEKILDDTLVKICVGGFEATDNCNSLIYKTVKSLSLEHNLNNTQDNSAVKCGKEVVPITTVSRSYVDQELDSAINKLNEADKDIVLMHIYFDITFCELAKDLAISVSQLQRRYKRIVKTLAKIIQQKEEHSGKKTRRDNGQSGFASNNVQNATQTF